MCILRAISHRSCKVYIKTSSQLAIHIHLHNKLGKCLQRVRHDKSLPYIIIPIGNIIAGLIGNPPLSIGHRHRITVDYGLKGGTLLIGLVLAAQA